MDLRSVPTAALQRELKERSRCVDCKTEWSTGWHAANAQRTRIRCADCHRQILGNGGSRMICVGEIGGFTEIPKAT